MQHNKHIKSESNRTAPYDRSVAREHDCLCRGGIPVCFPQFGGFGPLSQHGFARNSEFAVTDSAPESVTLSLTPNEEQLKLFPHPFALTVQVNPHAYHCTVQDKATNNDVKQKIPQLDSASW